MAKDSEFNKYIAKLGEIYFNVKPRPAGGFFGNLLQSFLLDSDEEEERVDNKPKQNQQPQQQASTSNPLSNPLPQLPPFSLFERMCQSGPTAAFSRPGENQNSKPSSNLQTHEDLD